ncbi:MAG: hypothetical protein AAFV07_14735, partial [Bacteroidota bacterium]
PFHYVNLDANGSLIEAGEALAEGKKEGRWLTFDRHKKLVEDAIYQKGVKRGWVRFYFRVEGQAATSEMGTILENKRVGWWIAMEEKKPGNDKWKRNYFSYYDDKGKLRSQVTFHKNGRPASLMEFDAAGEGVREFEYNKKGQLMYQGKPREGTVPLTY